MSKDFSGQNLRGRSFKGQDLEGADFSHADIRGADFTNANLRNANLSYVKSGLQKYKIVCWIEFLSILGFLLLFASVSTSGGTWWKLVIETNSYSEIQKKVFIFTLVIIGMLLVSISILIWKNLIYSLEFITLTLSILILTSGITHTLNLDKYKILRDWTEALTLAFLILIAVSGMVAVSLVLIKTLTPNFTVIPMFVSSLGGMIGALYRVLIRDGWNDLFSEPIFSWNWAWLDLIWGCSWCFILVLLGSYIGWLFWIEDKRVPSIRKLINAIAAIGGTKFYNANLTKTDFTSANLKNTDFKKANLTRTRFYETKKLELARLGNTILAERSILNLLVTGNGRGKSYAQITNFSNEELQNLSNELKKYINNWFNSKLFIKVANQLRSKLNPSDSIRFIIQTSDINLKLLPLHLWEFFDDYRKAEIALSALHSDRLSKTVPKRNKVRVLVILGNSKGIETGVQADLEVLNKLPLSEIKVLSQPNKEDLHEQLWHPLGWDIICYSGHSDSKDDGSTGVIEIDETNKISLKFQY